MNEYRHGSHSVFTIHLHLVLLTKYRKPVLVGDVAFQVRELIRAICRSESVDIIKGHISKITPPIRIHTAPSDYKSSGAKAER